MRVPPTFRLIFALSLLLLLPLLLACNGTITIEESTEEADGSRTVRVSSTDERTPAATRPPIPTPEPGERVAFPALSELFLVVFNDDSIIH